MKGYNVFIFDKFQTLTDGFATEAESENEVKEFVEQLLKDGGKDPSAYKICIIERANIKLKQK